MKILVFQGLEESATAFEFDPTKILAHGNKKDKMLYTELLKGKTPAEVEAFWIPAATLWKDNTNVYFTSYAPVPPFMLEKTMEYNSPTS